jgi:hypothetical protein
LAVGGCIGLGEDRESENATHEKIKKRKTLKCPQAFYMKTLKVLNWFFNSYLLTQWNRVLLKKLTISHLIKKFPAVYGTQRFIAAFTSVRHMSLS